MQSPENGMDRNPAEPNNFTTNEILATEPQTFARWLRENAEPLTIYTYIAVWGVSSAMLLAGDENIRKAGVFIFGATITVTALRVIELGVREAIRFARRDDQS